MNVIVPRKTVVEVRFNPNLRYFRRMDDTAITLQKTMDVKDWEKTEISVEIQDAKNHERVRIEFHRVFSEFDSSVELQSDSIDRGTQLIELCLDGLGVEEIQSIGIRQWFAIDRGAISESKLIAKILNIYFDENIATLARKSSMQIKDLAITLELEDSAEPRKKGRLILGAMSKSQWTAHLRYSGTGHLDAKAIAEIVESLPTDFVFVDLDMRFGVTDNTSSLPRSKLAEWASFVKSKQSAIPKQIINDL